MQKREAFCFRVVPPTLATLAALLGAACSDDEQKPNNTNTAGAGGGGNGGAAGAAGSGAMSGSGGSSMDISATPAATSGDYTAPFDAVPNSNASVLYFTANSSTGPSAFSVPAAGGAVTRLTGEDAFVSPLGIAIRADDQELFIADPGAENENGQKGRVWVLPVGGGTPSVLSGTLGLSPRGLEVAEDHLYFSGIDPSDGEPGVFRIPTAGGQVQVIAKGEPLHDPSGLAITRSGDIYVVDTIGAENGLSTLLKVTGSTASVFHEGLPVGYPAGIALTLDDSTLLVSGIDASRGTSTVYALNLLTHQLNSFSNGIGSNVDSGGLHRARTTQAFAWNGVTAGGQGIVYTVTLKN